MSHTRRSSVGFQPRWSAGHLLPSGRLVDLARWRAWVASRHGVGRMEQWAATHPGLVGWDQQRLVVVGGTRSVLELEAPQASPRTDAMQAALVELAQHGDAEAAVTLLVNLRPGLGRLIPKVRSGLCWSHQDAVEEVRAVFFEVLIGHSLERRPTRIAANLLLDTRQRLFRASRSRRSQALLETVGDGSRTQVGDHGEVLVLETLRSVIESLPGSPDSHRLTSDLAYRAWVLEQPGAMIAEELGLGHQGVRSRLHRLRQALYRDGSLQESA